MANNQPVCYRGTFQHCHIRWSIKNFTLLPVLDDYEIYTPEFNVNYPSLTRWKLGLKSTNTGQLSNISLFLTRLATDNGPETVLVDWRAAILDPFKLECFSMDCESSLKEHKEVEIELLGYPEIYRALRDNLPDTLYIQCELIINHDLGSENLHDPEMDLHLQFLTRDLNRLYKHGTFHDLVLKAGERYFRTHRAILSSRNLVLFKLIETILKADNERNLIVLPQQYSDAAEQVLHYLYTGDINHIVKRPTVCLLKLMDFLGMDEIKKAFTGHDFKMLSYVLYKEYEFCWNIENFWAKNLNYIASQLYFDQTDPSPTFWKLHLFPRGLNGDREYMDLVLEYVSGTKTVDVSIVYTVLNLDNEPMRVVRDFGRVQVTERVYTFDFFPRDCLSQTIKHDLFTIIFTIQISENKRHSIIELDAEKPPPPQVPIKIFYAGLALNLGKMATRQVYDDITLSAQNKSFAVHKCVLASRSKILYNILKKEKRSVVELNMRSIILVVFLNYLYGKDINYVPVNGLKRLYEVSIIFGVPSLKVLCTKYLKRSFTAENVGDILEFAENNQDEDLKLAAVTYICESEDRNDQEANNE